MDGKQRSGPPSPLRRAWRWVRDLPGPWAAALATLVAVGVGIAGLYMYRTYQFVEHDNEFCLSCHLMENPFERFARSAHRDLSCKACHQPTFAARSQMALTQIVEQPDTLVTHAEVPNERCAECHIEGDPEKWRTIRNTAGHKVHLESDDPELGGLQCVECHSTSLHEFAPTDRTCGQAGCHEDTSVRLGRMGELTIHCVACHAFTDPVRRAAGRASDDGPGPLTPGLKDCLSCHRMRAMMADLPEDEPHEARCATCHNPHEHEEPRDALATCTDAGCHERADTLPTFHHQRPTIRLSQCTNCHEAHEFRVDEDRCLDCHADILREERSASSGAGAGPDRRGSRSRSPPVRRSGTGPAGGPSAPAWSPPPRRAAGSGDGGDPTGRASLVHRREVDAPPTPAPQDTTRFRHTDHREMDCRTCHRTGEPGVTTDPRWCQDCHHTEPVSRPCETCHRADEYRARLLDASRTLRFSVSDSAVRRTLPFRHEPHAGLECSRCHTDPPALSAAGADCAACHEEHHEEDAGCTACHVEAPAEAHPTEAHLTCTGSGCHDPAPFPEVPRGRNACLACHGEMSDHEPGQRCADCHVLPPPHPQGGAAAP